MGRDGGGGTETNRRPREKLCHCKCQPEIGMHVVYALTIRLCTQIIISELYFINNSEWSFMFCKMSVYHIHLFIFAPGDRPPECFVESNCIMIFPLILHDSLFITLRVK